MSKTDIKKRFGLMVRNCRIKLDLTQEELALRAGLHRTYISDIERGKRNVAIENVEKIVAATELSIVELFSLTNDVPTNEFPSKTPILQNINGTPNCIP